MRYTLTVCVLIIFLVHRNIVASEENIFLTYHYETGTDLTVAVCDCQEEYVVHGENTINIDLKYIEPMTYAVCILLEDKQSITAANNFKLITTMYRSELKPVRNSSYECKFYIKNQKGTHYAPIVKLDNVDYVMIECNFTVKVIPANPILLNVTVNGNELVPSGKSADNVIYADYQYPSDDRLIAVCRKRTTMAGSVQISLEGAKASDTYGNQKRTISKAKFDVNHPKTLGPNFTLKCVFNDGDNIIQMYNIDFSPAVTPSEIKVEGLRSSNIVHKKESGGYMFYKYTNIEEIELKCSSNCLKENCKMEIWYNGSFISASTSHISVMCSGMTYHRLCNMLNFTPWGYANTKISISHPFILTPYDNSSLIKCILFREPETNIISKNINISLWYVGEIANKAPFISTTTTTTTVSTIPTIATTQTTATKPKQNHGGAMPTQATTVTTTNAIPTINNTGVEEYKLTTFDKVFPTACFIIVEVFITMSVVIICMWCKRRRSPAKSEAIEMIATPAPQSRLEVPEPVYEEIPAVISHPQGDGRKLKLIPGIKLNPKTGMLTVNGTSVDVGNLLHEHHYEEIGDRESIIPPS